MTLRLTGATLALLAAVGCATSAGEAAATGGISTGSTAHASAQRSAKHFRGTPAVGALFVPGLYPAMHTCTAAVIRSRRGDVIMTAAHCVSGTGAGYRFVPGYRNGAAPYGVWNVTGAYGDPAWTARQDPHRDWAFLTVATRQVRGRSRSLQSITGGYRLGYAPKSGAAVKVIGYALGRNDKPLRCVARVYRHSGYPAFNCGGYVGGTSGSPWLRHAGRRWEVVGDIGGLHQGGCSPATSYSPPLGGAAHRALRKAESGRNGTVFPVAGPDGCS